jgi:predicted phage baseplate assembly protein
MSDTCGCCSGVAERTPAPIMNRPGLSRIAYRVGIHADFLATMLARLTTHALPENGARPLHSLTTRATDDPSIALLDAWAVVADVLSFYQERIANEGYLRTATERRSIRELARLVGYRLRPGVAASVYLAYTMEAGVAVDTVIPAGSRAQSVPRPGELPQSFETSLDLKARTSWNAIRSRQTRPQLLTPERFEPAGTLYLQGITTNLKPNAPLLLTFAQPRLYRVLAVTPDAELNRTAVRLQPWLPSVAANPQAQRIREAAAQHADLAQFGVEDRQMARELVDDLNRLAVAANLSANDLMRATEELLVRLRRAHAVAEDSGFTRLAPWLNSAVVALDAALDEDRFEPVLETTTAVPTLAGLVRAIDRRPARPPASSQQLRRNLAGAFAAGSGAAAALLGSLRPELARGLYAGWRALPVATQAAVVESHALRTQAGVYGGAAPQRVTIPGPDGGEVTYKEWELEVVDTAATALRVEFVINLQSGYGYDEYGYEGPSSARGAQATIRVGDAEVIVEIDRLPDSGTSGSSDHSVGGERVRFTLGAGSIGEFSEQVAYFVTVAFPSRLGERKLPSELNMRIVLEQGRVDITADGLTLEATLVDSTVVEEGTADEGPVLRVRADATIPRPIGSEAADQVALDVPNVAVTPGSFVVVERPQAQGSINRLVIAQAVAVKDAARADYGISGKSTQITLDRPWLAATDNFAVLRGTTVFAQSEQLELAEEPITTPVCGDRIVLDGLYDGLEAGRWLIVAGEQDLPGVSGVRNAELVMIQSVVHMAAPDAAAGEQPLAPGERPHTIITLDGGLTHCYINSSVRIYANVVPATHGETRREILGAGDGSKPLQRFDLRFTPLTYTPAATPSGVESSLDVFVNDVRWHEAPALAGLGPTDQRFTTRQDDEQRTTVIFGNGERGARLPTGRENVRAVYRNGIGKAGNVAAEAITLLATRSLGVQGVNNPLAASGGADPESRDQARINAPLAVTALDRLVGVQDYADFARTFAGIGKAYAARLSHIGRPLVHLTIAGADDIPITPISALYRSLREALLRFGDPALAVRIGIRERVALVLSANVMIHPDYIWEKVEAEVRRRLLERFSFNQRELGQDALLSEAIAVAQAVPGVQYVDVDAFGGVAEQIADPQAEDGRRIRTPDEFAAAVQEIAAQARPQERVSAETTRHTVNSPIRPAQLAVLVPDAPDTLILQRIDQ